MIAAPMAAERDDERSVCTPCRGTGILISNLGGSQHQVTCPWCGGTGRFQAGRDAQTRETVADPQSEDA
jgi:DnaJ-class molecular chaperone